MNFGAILDAVCKDGIDPSRRADAKGWVAARHAWLWDPEDWTFKLATGTVTFTAGSQMVAAGDAPTDIHATLALYDSGGGRVQGISDPRRFFDDYNQNLGGSSGPPEAYTLVDGTIFLSSPGDGSQGLLVYERSKPSLVNDADETGLPDGYDLALVHGAKAEGFKLTNIPLSGNFDADYTAAIETLRRAYLRVVKEPGQQFGAYRP